MLEGLHLGAGEGDTDAEGLGLNGFLEAGLGLLGGGNGSRAHRVLDGLGVGPGERFLSMG